MNINQELEYRTQQAKKIEDSPDRLLADRIVAVGLIVYQDKGVMTALQGAVALAYALGLTAKHDTALEAGTRLLEGLDEK